MNKVVDVEIGGKNCRLYFSVAALFRLQERFGEVDTLGNIWRGILPDDGSYDIFVAPGIFENVVQLAAEMMASGTALAKANGESEIAAYTADELRGVLSPMEYIRLHAAVIECLRIGMGRTVETEGGSKNAIATQGD